MPDFNNLPVILAGPMVRRVDPSAVSVWVALSAPRTVELGIWTGLTAATAGFFGNGTAEHTGTANTIRLGDKLHLAIVTVAAPLIPGQIYSYNLVFTGPAGNADLSSLDYLVDQGQAAAPTRLALGYLPAQLPSFAFPPVALDQLKLVHGSCRKPHGHGPDGLAALDTMIQRTLDDPIARPHQLFLTGDQIYADDVAMMLLPQLTVAGNALLGLTERLPLVLPSGETLTEATPENFPATWRQELMRQQAKFTSGSASSHLISFGEFCAHYLFSWSNVLWEDPIGVDDLFPTDDVDDTFADLPAHLQELYPLPKKAREGKIRARNELKESYEGELADVKEFRKTLPKVQRALANIPSYMIFDDHEITDDWYLAQDWRDKVLTAPLGVTIIRNGLLSYTLFQAWGNVPAQFTTGTPDQLLDLTPQLMTGAGPPSAIADQLDQMFGFDGTEPSLRWDFTVPTGPTTTVVLDTRTRRSFEGRLTPPGLLSQAALDEQLPASLAPSPGAEVLLVIAPAPVLGLALIEELAQPIAARAIADFVMSVVIEGEPAITGYFEWDFEAWALNTPRFEAFLARCNEMGKVVLLSGDVHYACSAEMDYWKDGQPKPSRIVQLTASALKNAWVDVAKRALETVKVQKLMHTAFYPAARLGWDNPLDLQGNLNVPGGAIPRQLRALLRRTPTVIPTEGWPAGTTIAVNPDWAWRMSLLMDERPDDSSPGARPADGQIGSLPADIVPADPEAGYVAVLQRSEKQVKAKIARSVAFASNLGLVTFSGTGDTLHVRHALTYVHPAGAKQADPQPYTVHEASVAPTSDSPPTIA